MATTTPNLNLNVPDHGDQNWDVPINENWLLIDAAVAGKQATLTFDSTPTNGSSNPVTSDGLYLALLGKANDNAVVKLTGNQTVADVKTFSSSPILPTPATSDNSTKGATTAYVKNQGYVSSSSLATVHVVVETYVNGASWYRVYDDGWVEQGGFITGSNNAFATVTFLKAFSNTNYTIICAMQGTTNADRFAQYNNKTTTSVELYRDGAGTGIAWYTCGYGA